MRLALATLSLGLLVAAATTSDAQAVSSPPAQEPAPAASAQGPPATAPAESAQSPAAPVRVGGQVVPPRKTKDVKPVYPSDAQIKKISGIVIMEATIAVDGRVTDVRVTRSTPGLDEAAMTAVRGWEFTPTLIDGVPTPIVMSVTVNFQLNGSRSGSVRPQSPGPLEMQALRQGGMSPAAPARISGALPGYPAKEKNGATGTVRLRVTVDEKGRVREVRVLSDLREWSSGEGLGKSFVEPAMKAVKNWRYDPPARSPIMFDVQLRFAPGQETQDIAPGRGAMPR